MHLLPRVVPTQHGVRKWEASYPRLTVFNRYKANWPEKYWASRSQGPIDAHVLASHKGGTMFEGEDIIKYADLVDTAPDVFLFGHWHKNQGVEEIGGKQFVNIGSLTRGSLSQDNLDRVPAAAALRCTSDGVKVEVVPLNVRPSEDVFDVEGRERQVKRQVEMDSFVTAIRDALQPAKDGETLADAVTGMDNVPNEIRERALAYLESA